MRHKIGAMVAVLVLVGTAAAVVPNADVVRPAGNVGKAYETAVTAKSAEMKSAKVDELKENVKKSSVVMSLRDERGDVGSVQTGIGPASKGDTLGYDDGTAENAWAFYAAGNGWGVKFTPAQYPVNVDGALIYFWGNDWPNPGGNLMDLWIVDDDGANGAPQTVLYSAEGVTITRGDWNYIELPSKIMITEGSFYIFYIQHDDYPNCPGLAIDESTIPPAGTQWEYVNGTYIDTTYDGAWMIRAVVSPGGDPLDPLAAAGMWVVTNECENKTEKELENISSNLLAAKPTIASVAEKLAWAAKHCDDEVARREGAKVNWASKWGETFDEDKMARIIGWLK